MDAPSGSYTFFTPFRGTIFINRIIIPRIMDIRNRYEKARVKLLCDQEICRPNRELFIKFFDYEEYKLKRMNNLNDLDSGCFKTLLAYIQRFRNLNKWLQNKPWCDLTKEDIKRVYDDLEEGRFKNWMGNPIADRISYYNKIMKSKPFRMVDKAELAREVMEFYKPEDNTEVRFINESAFQKIEIAISKVEYKTLLWLAWDIGENINSLLQLKGKHFRQQTSQDGKEVEYAVMLPKHLLKRSRTSRTELTNYSETVKYLDIVLRDLPSDSLLFPFGYASSKKFLNRAIARTGVKCVTGQKPTWKDFRSGMACHLLRKGWTRDEINARLGHKPSSREIDKYITFLAIDRKRVKAKQYSTNLAELQDELHQIKLKGRNHMLHMEQMESTFAEDRQALEHQILGLQRQVAQSQLRENVIIRLLRSMAKKGKLEDIFETIREEELAEELRELEKRESKVKTGNIIPPSDSYFSDFRPDIPPRSNARLYPWQDSNRDTRLSGDRLR